MTATSTKPAARKPSIRTAKPAPKASAKQAPAPKEPVTPKATPKEKAPKPEAKTLIEALITGQAALIKVRANGTKRSLPYLAVGTEGRKAAEAVAARVDKGEAVTAIAEDLKVSLATARRFLTNLALAHAVEAGSHDAAWTKGTHEVVVHSVTAKGSKA